MNVPALPTRSAHNAKLVADFDDALVECNLAALFDGAANRDPNAVAVIGSDRTITYGELATRSMRVAHHLRARGLRPEQPVGVYMQRTTDVIAVLLGILRAGGAYVPLDPAEPVERARALTASAGVRIVLGDAALLESLREAKDRTDADDNCTTLAPPVLIDAAGILDDTCPLPAGEPTDAPRCEPGGSRLAYVLFTSGSTGRPKGVEVEHRNVINLLLSARQAFSFTNADRYLAVATLSFDISVVEVFLPLITGGSLVLADKQLLLERGATAAAIERHAVTVFQTGPSVWSLLLEAGRTLPRLRVAITTGEAMPPSLAHRLAGIADVVWNLYGPTETTIWCTGHRLDLADGFDGSTEVAAPLGRMWPNMPGIVIDDSGRTVADGEQGELWVGGLAVTRGYRDDPERTQERYVLREDGGRYYRTGDVVARRPDGILRFFGRNDDQIQIHGVRTEPMEVESVVRNDPSVRSAATTWYVTPSGAKAIVAGVVMRPGVSASATTLHERLATQLMSAMVPSRFVFYDDALPMTPNGKTDRVAIRADAERLVDDSSTGSRVDEELSPTQRRLLAIWRHTLSADVIGKNDSFFYLGGDSLAAVMMVLDVEEEFGVSLALKAVLAAPTLEGMATLIEGARSAPSTTEANDCGFTFRLVEGGTDAPVFFCAVDLTFALRGVWTPNCPLYAVNYWALGTGFTRAKTLRELAGAHVAEIRRVQPHGPYRIAGFSFGGITALEIATQLREVGEEIELLFLLDPTEPFRTRDKPDIDRADLRRREQLYRRVVRHARAASHQSEHNRGAVLPYIAKKAKLVPLALVADKKAWSWVQYRRVDLHGRHANALTAKLLPRDRWIGFGHVAERLARDYLAHPFEGNSLAIFSSRNERTAAWRDLLGPTSDLHIVECAHAEMVAEPALSTWMATLRDRLQ